MVFVSDTSACSDLVGAVLGRFLVVAVPMEQLEVHQPVIPSQGLRNDVVGLSYISITEIQSTTGTLPLLKPQQITIPRIRQGMVPQSLRPVDEVAIIRTGRTLHLCVASNRCCAMRFQPSTILGREFPAFALVHRPIFARYPSSSFIRVTTVCPAPQHVVEQGITSLEGFFRHHHSVVIRPSQNDRIEVRDQPRLRSRPLLSNDLAQRDHMRFDGLSTGFDERLEPQRLSGGAMRRASLSGSILSHVETKKVKPRCSLQGMDQTSFAGLQFQSDAL